MSYYHHYIKYTKRRLTGVVVIIIVLFGGYSVVRAWGVWAHQRICRAAVFALPPEMKTFFYNHIDFLTQESVVPDLRKYTLDDKAEFSRHYIDVEAFGSDAFKRLPPLWKDAKAKYHADTLRRNGILPWYMQEMLNKLTAAFKQGRKDEILFLAADFSHYIADAHMPLHTSLNHDGQFTDQRGVHAFWESSLPEQFGGDYNFNTGEAKYIADPVAEIWSIIRQSNAAADTLLTTEQALRRATPKEKMYVLDSNKAIVKNKFNQPIHTYDYSKKYHDALRGMVERRLRAAISVTANFWYTAWVNAGKPNLTLLDSESTTKRNLPHLEEETALWQRGKLFDFKSEAEF